MHATKIFDTSTLAGLKAAERFKARLNERFERVEVKTIGLSRVQIMGFDSRREFYGAALTDNNGRSTEE